MAEQKYKRLTGDRLPTQFSVVAVSRFSLWLGDDHLLHVETTGYSEKYKRFFFRDIQAFTIRKTKRRMVWNWVLGALLALSALIILIAASDAADAAVAATIAGCTLGIIFGIPLLLNNLLGPTCTCEIRTAVQTESLPSLSRVQKTRKVMNRIRPLIIAAQGQLTGEEVAAQMREVVSTPAAAIDPASDLPPVIS